MNDHGPTHRTRTRRLLIRGLLVVVITPLILIGLSLLGLFPWSGLNCWTSEIDIYGGRIRETRYLLWIPVSRTIRDSALTTALDADDFGGRPAEWRPIVTLSPRLHHSPHYKFHGAIALIRELEFCWELGRMTPRAREASARGFLRLWKWADADYAAYWYLQAISDRMLEVRTEGGTIDEDDLPSPETIEAHILAEVKSEAESPRTPPQNP